jgi:hypothetical protein
MQKWLIYVFTMKALPSIVDLNHKDLSLSMSEPLLRECIRYYLLIPGSSPDFSIGSEKTMTPSATALDE